MMVNKINDIAWQARQGSVAAIIQVLNNTLANSGIRTRAIFEDGTLQLLCEAHTVDKLDQSILVKQIQQILESIAPNNIRKVNINSRIVREEQLLWLEEISRAPENQLLWSEEIILDKPNILQQVIKDFRERTTELEKPYLPKIQSSRPFIITNNQSKTYTWGQIFIILSLCLFLLMTSWAIYAFLNGKFKNQFSKLPTPLSPLTTSEYTNQVDSQSQVVLIKDVFAESVRIANQTSADGKTAITSTQWLEIAANWQRASDLMSQVSPTHTRYKEAQIRTKLYQKYSKAAQKEAQKSKL